ncbi:MAG TPA: outer membrane lipoprotein carrier protein LolA [Desulfobacterales bacterium]|nr:outer membrane lipoprotein carrier protein LolA [Desulfobacterales bacterium]
MKYLITVCLFFASVVTIQAQGENEASPVRVESVQAEFTQEKQLPILARPIISKGTFLFQAPDSLRWEYFSPIHTVLLMHDGHTRKFIQRDGKFTEEHGMGVDSMQIVLQEITGWLDGEITDTATFQVKSKEGETIILVPKNEALTKIISRIVLKLFGTSGLMESVTLYEGPDSLTRMVFSEGLLNKKIPAVRFIEP